MTKRKQAESVSIQIIIEYAHLPPVECYAGQLNQVFMNILSNAIHAVIEIPLRQKKAVN